MKAALLLALWGASLSATQAPQWAVAPTAGRGAPEGLRAAVMAGVESVQGPAVFPAEDKIPGEKVYPCFDPRCAERLLRKTGSDAVLLSALRPARGRSWDLLLALHGPGDNVRALRRRVPAADSLLGMARAAAADLAESRGDMAAGRWGEIRWLLSRDSTDRRRGLRYGLLGAIALTGGIALAQDQLRFDPVSEPAPPQDGAPSGQTSAVRGFFAAPPLDARSQGRGGAGASLSPDALAVMLNPAAIGGLVRPSLVMARSRAADGSPRLAAAYASPSSGAWAQGGALYYAGDGLASEATAAWGLAWDLEGWGGRLSGILLGAAAKLYLAQVGEDGLGQDRSRGRSSGLGLDLGVVLPLEERFRMGFAFRDIPAFLWHRNDLTDRQGGEFLPPEFRAAAAAQAGEDLEIFLEGQKGLWEDAPAHLRIGGEQALFRILRARGGYHQIFGDETVRRFSLGCGLDTRGLRIRPSLAVNFAFEYGLGDHEALAASQQFSLELRF